MPRIATENLKDASNNELTMQAIARKKIEREL